MRLLLDEHLPIGLCAELHGDAVDTVSGRGWTGIKNGELRRRMGGHYDALVTMDRSIRFQQRISTLPFGIVVVGAPSNRMQDLRPACAVDPRRRRRGQARAEGWKELPLAYLTLAYRDSCAGGQGGCEESITTSALPASGVGVRSGSNTTANRGLCCAACS